MATNDPVPKLQMQCICHCRDKTPAFSPRAESWNEALDQHRFNLISLVIPTRPLVSWIRHILGVGLLYSGEIGYRLSLAEMHRMYMRALQIELVKIGVAMRFNNDDEVGGSAAKQQRLQAASKYATENIEAALARYTQAVRDYEYMTTTSRAHDYFIVSSERCHDRTVLLSALDDYSIGTGTMYDEAKDDALPTGPWEYPVNNRAKPIGGTRYDSIKSQSRNAFWWKLGAAIVGTGFLIGPMWLLSLKQRLYLQLEATTGFVFGFGLVLAYFMEKIDQVFAGTLAYAAVLMVFVGLSIQGSSGD